MKTLTNKLKELNNSIKTEIKHKVELVGVNTNCSIEKGLIVKKDYYVDGRIIDYITENKLIADGYHFDHHCLEIDELCELVDSIEVPKLKRNSIKGVKPICPDCRSRASYDNSACDCE